VRQQAAEAPRLVSEGGGGMTILLVEDGDLLRALTAQILASGGYQVLTARHGTEALELARQFPAAIDLLITDVVMPGMLGTELARRLVAERPELRVLLISGESEETFRRANGRTSGHFLRKPFIPEELLQRVRGLLGR
jgi:DNA-binding response OmpR family regulator